MTVPASKSGQPAREARPWVWLQFAIGWLPIWALYATLVVAAHRGSFVHAAIASSRAIVAAAALSLLVVRLVNRLPWPRPITLRFVGIHTLTALLFAPAWVGLTSAIESLIRWRLVISAPPEGIAPFMVLGLWLYIAVVGVLYAVRATARAGHAEAAAAESQLAALRSQLNPHFLFNALHTVVQLIPIDPARASSAAEELAGLLRTALEEDRDVVTLREERAFVERYIALEHIRFGERLQVVFDLDARTLDVSLPAFAMQTLVENAVRHGASPSITPTKVTVTATLQGDVLLLTVSDTGVGSSAVTGGTGTGLNRLRARLDALYGARASLHTVSSTGQGFTATVTVPRVPLERD